MEEQLIKEANKSKCKKRKVGAFVVDLNGAIIGRGHNRVPTTYTGDCEDPSGNTYEYVIHAEVAAIAQCTVIPEGCAMYVTHAPCEACEDAIKAAGIKEVHVINEFMKFDSGKLRYSLIPPIVTKALATVLTYGAKKYKPDNWKQVDSVERYWDALYRHLEARRAGERLDPESGLSHLWHAITNIGFIIYLNERE